MLGGTAPAPASRIRQRQSLNDPGVQKFQRAQGQLSARFPAMAVLRTINLKATLFRDLRSQLESTENRITVARNRYIRTCRTSL